MICVIKGHVKHKDFPYKIETVYGLPVLSDHHCCLRCVKPLLLLEKLEEQIKLRGLPIPECCNELNKLNPYHTFLEKEITNLMELKSMHDDTCTCDNCRDLIIKISQYKAEYDKIMNS